MVGHWVCVGVGVWVSSYNDHGPVYTWKKPVLPEDQPKPVVVSERPLRRNPSSGCRGRKGSWGRTTSRAGTTMCSAF